MSTPRPIPAPVTRPARRSRIRGGYDPNGENEAGDPALHYAIEEREQPGVLLLLLAAGADMNHKDEFNHTALGYALARRARPYPRAGKIVELLDAAARIPQKPPS